jgi:hypothetical protein
MRHRRLWKTVEEPAGYGANVNEARGICFDGLSMNGII